MSDIGFALKIDPDVRKSCMVDNNTSIGQAVYEMLHCWYKTQDGLGKNSKGLKCLKDALVEVNKPSLVDAVILKHFDEIAVVNIKEV